ncbi:MAG: hypothetical protein L3J97_02290 [Thermoplasmata archaeon]|nr:hypothetical protein [Thermoplasmata archaeon]
MPHSRFTLEAYFRKLTRAGFRILDIIEPRPTAVQTRAHISLEGPRRIPFWLMLNAETLTPRHGGRKGGHRR